MNHSKKSLKLRIGYELAYEIIFTSIIIIFIGSAFLFASNLLRFNWYTSILVIIAIYLLYLKYNSYLQIMNNSLKVINFRFFTKIVIPLSQIHEVIFYANKRKVDLKTGNEIIFTLYLTEKKKKYLFNWLMTHQRDIACFYINKDEKTAK